MTLRLEDTNAGAVAAAIHAERHRAGASGAGMVMTLVIVVDEENQSDATQAAQFSAGEHPCRILTVIPRPGRGGEPQLDAGINVGDSDGPGELVRLRLRGDLAFHAESVVLPLLLSDTPVVVWWPTTHPDNPAADPLGSLASRRIVDTFESSDFAADLAALQANLHPGDTDLAWTRLTPWRAALATIFDQAYPPITSATVYSDPIPSAPLLRTWLQWRLAIPVGYERSDGPLINKVAFHTTEGDITITRPEGHLAMVTRNDKVVREIVLPRRPLRELISEELRRLDPDDTYEETMRRLDLAHVVPDDTDGEPGDQQPSDAAIRDQRSLVAGSAILGADLANPRRSRGEQLLPPAAAIAEEEDSRG